MSDPVNPQHPIEEGGWQRQGRDFIQEVKVAGRSFLVTVENVASEEAANEKLAEKGESIQKIVAVAYMFGIGDPKLKDPRTVKFLGDKIQYSHKTAGDKSKDKEIGEQKTESLLNEREEKIGRHDAENDKWKRHRRNWEVAKRILGFEEAREPEEEQNVSVARNQVVEEERREVAESESPAVLEAPMPPAGGLHGPELEARDEKIRDLEAKQETLQRQLEKLEAADQKKRSHLNKKIKRNQRIIKKLRAKVEALEQEDQRGREELATARLEARRYQGHTQAFNQRSEVDEGRIRSLRARQDELKAENSTLSDQLAKQQEEWERANENIQRLEGDLHDQKRAVAETKAALAEKEQEVDALKRSLADTRPLDEAIAAKEKLEQTLKGLEEENQDLQRQLAQEREDRKVAAQHLEAKEAQIAALKSEGKGKQPAVSEATVEREQLNEEMAATLGISGNCSSKLKRIILYLAASRKFDEGIYDGIAALVETDKTNIDEILNQKVELLYQWVQTKKRAEIGELNPEDVKKEIRLVYSGRMLARLPDLIRISGVPQVKLRTLKNSLNRIRQ